MNSHELNCVARGKVEAELLQRGAVSVISRGTRKIHLHAGNPERSRTVVLKVKAKSKRKGNWHTRTDEAKLTITPPKEEDVRDFWVFVDFDSAPRYWVVPDWWIRNEIYEKHKQYLNKHGGHRPVNDDSNHHSIDETQLESWQNKWEILGIF
jgi:hypothetical protein